MPDWHPIMAAEEREPGVWTMVDPLGQEYGRVEIRRTADGIRYRAEMRGQELGWGRSLRQSCMVVHSAYLRTLGPQGGPVARWGS